MADMQTTVITISLQVASGGAYVGHLLAKKLGYKYVEREVLFKAAEELGLDVREASRQDECGSGFVQDLMKSFLFGTPEAAYVPPARRPVYDHDLFEAESKIIRSIAELHNAVIVGHGGYFVLRDRPQTLHVLIHTSMEFGIERFRTDHHRISPEQAREEIKDLDQKRDKYLKTMTVTDRYDARNYHLCIDTENAGSTRFRRASWN